MRKLFALALVFTLLFGLWLCLLADQKDTMSRNIVIHEIMQNPAAVSDANGEWFELYNVGDEDVDINGWRIGDNGNDNHVIDNGGSLIVPARGYLVLGKNGDQEENGGVSVDYEYADFTLSNGDDEIIVLDGDSLEVDRVEFDGGPVLLWN
jgi:hypothetical protein